MVGSTTTAFSHEAAVDADAENAEGLDANSARSGALSCLRRFRAGPRVALRAACERPCPRPRLGSRRGSAGEPVVTHDPPLHPVPKPATNPSRAGGWSLVLELGAPRARWWCGEFWAWARGVMARFGAGRGGGAMCSGLGRVGAVARFGAGRGVGAAFGHGVWGAVLGAGRGGGGAVGFGTGRAGRWRQTSEQARWGRQTSESDEVGARRAARSVVGGAVLVFDVRCSS